MCVQYYFRDNSASFNSYTLVASSDGGSNRRTASTPNNFAGVTSWTKRTEIITRSNTMATGFGFIGFASHETLSAAIDIDDIIVFPGTAADVSAPSLPPSALISIASTTSQNVSWTAPSGGVDGGGDRVICYSVNPVALDIPNVNGVRAVGRRVTVTALTDDYFEQGGDNRVRGVDLTSSVVTT
jgi:hypothetical protein